LTKNNIKLVYTDNGRLVLTCRDFKGIKVIYAGKIFNNCSDDIANAVVNLYTFKDTEAYEIVLNYTNKLSPASKISADVRQNNNGEMSIMEFNVSSFLNKDIKLDDSYF
jgi:S-adenosylmethionine synthetase